MHGSTPFREPGRVPSEAPCAACGRPIDPQTAVYAKSGDLVCKSCESQQMVDSSAARAGHVFPGVAAVAGIVAWLTGGAWALLRNDVFDDMGSLSALRTLVSLVSLFGIAAPAMAVAAFIAGLHALILLRRPEIARFYGARLGSMTAAAWTGLVLGGLYALITVPLAAIALLR